LRVIVNGEMQLGELVLYDGDGTQMPTSALTVSENGAALFDEAETVPKKVSYRNGTYFDEVYHARTAYEHINGIAPYEISHPPLGKLIISIGVRLFGMTPFGWRFMGALLGVLMLPLLYTLLKCLFGNTLISVCGTVVFAFDFMHFVQTRIATIDSYAVFFILLMYLCFYLFLRSDKLGQPVWKSRLPLALAGLFFGIGCACKWTVLYGGIGLGVLWLMHWVGRLHTEGKTAQQAFWSNVRWCLLFFVAVPLFVYYISYTPYGTAVGLQGAKMYFSRDYLSIVLENQSYMLHYHSSLSSEHIYSSRWYEWLLDLRPMLYWVEKSEGISASIAAFVSPLLCWGGLASVGATAYLGVRRKDTRALFLVVGYLAQLLPWAFVSRTTFVYHYFACTVFLTLCLCYVLNYLREKGYCWKGFAWGISSASIGLFVVFYPILSGTAVSDSYQNFLRWLPKFWKF
ncbi:MAG: phospholipid carrier-dependent glycosyltransferase, partial [Oscillospiraceae bacterium]